MGAGALWRVISSDGSVRAEIWAHPDGWECRVYVREILEHADVFVDPRDAHLEALGQVRQLRIVERIATERPRIVPSGASSDGADPRPPEAPGKGRTRPGT